MIWIQAPETIYRPSEAAVLILQKGLLLLISQSHLYFPLFHATFQVPPEFSAAVSPDQMIEKLLNQHVQPTDRQAGRPGKYLYLGLPQIHTVDCVHMHGHVRHKLTETHVIIAAVYLDYIQAVIQLLQLCFCDF